MAFGSTSADRNGSTWTYYVYVTDGAGARRQVSKGGFRTRKEAEAARINSLSTMQSGTWVRPERVTVREFIEDESLPTQAPPTLEESTYRSYKRYVHLHVVPHIGGITLQQLTPLDLTSMYRVLLDRSRDSGQGAAQDEIIVGLVVGKPLGIMLATAFGVRFRLGRLPEGLSFRRGPFQVKIYTLSWAFFVGAEGLEPPTSAL